MLTSGVRRLLLNTNLRMGVGVLPREQPSSTCDVLRGLVGDQVYGVGVWASLALMCASALCGSITDLAFDLEGYLWQLMNCLFTASYSLYLRGVMDRVVTLTVNKIRLDEFSMVRLHTSQQYSFCNPQGFELECCFYGYDISLLRFPQQDGA